MTYIDPALLSDATSVLTGLCADRCPPEEARLRLAQLRERWPDADLALIQDQEPYDGSVSYDLLLHGPDGTLSLAFSPAPQLPWPLRGVVRMSDDHLLRVNQTQLSVSHALAALDYVWSDRDVLGRLVDTCLILEELGVNPIEVADDELQHGADAYRRGKGLLTAQQTQAWLTEHGLTPAGLTSLIEGTVRIGTLRHRVVQERIESWVAGRAADGDTRPDEVVRRDAEHALFEDWLAQRRAVADVEWFWLGARQTSA